MNYYQRLVQQLSSTKDPFHSLQVRLSRMSLHTYKAIEIKKQTMTDAEKINASGYLPLDFFKDLDDMSRLACYCSASDAAYEKDLQQQINECTPYSGEEPIFQNATFKENRIKDLIKTGFGERKYGTNIFKLKKQWGYYDHRIPVEMYDWIERCFKNNLSRIRVEPNGMYNHCPPEQLLECMVVPPQGKWWKNLKVYNRTHVGCSFILLGNDPSNSADYIDYHRHNVRKLQVVASRKDSIENGVVKPYLSMLIEELSEFKHPTDPNRLYVIGRMIHLDTDAEIGTPFENAVLKHIDLAYNLYIDNDATIRMNQDLSNGGKVQDATTRTHILRVEDIPFDSIFKFSISFFRSKTLVSEWFSNEFGK